MSKFVELKNQSWVACHAFNFVWRFKLWRRSYFLFNFKEKLSVNQVNDFHRHVSALLILMKKQKTSEHIYQCKFLERSKNNIELMLFINTWQWESIIFEHVFSNKVVASRSNITNDEESSNTQDANTIPWENSEHMTIALLTKIHPVSTALLQLQAEYHQSSGLEINFSMANTMQKST